MLERAHQVTAAERLDNVRYELAAALRPEARLLLLVWQRYEDNEWAWAVDGALGDAAQSPRPGADPFSLGDAEATAGILEGAGFDDLRFEDIHEPVLYGHDLDAALAFVRGFQNTSAALATLSDDGAGVYRRAPAQDAGGALRRRAGRGPRFALLVDHRPATPLTTLTRHAKGPTRAPRSAHPDPIRSLSRHRGTRGRLTISVAADESRLRRARRC